MDSTVGGETPLALRRAYGRIQRRIPARVLTVIARLRRHQAIWLAAVAGFYGLLCLPSLIVAVIAGGSVAAIFMGPEAVDRLVTHIVSASANAFSPQVAADLVAPTVRHVLDQPRFDVVGIGTILAVWSSSRMINVLVMGLRIINEVDEQSGVRTRLLALKTTLIGVAFVVAAAPLMTFGLRYVFRYINAGTTTQVFTWIVLAIVAVFLVGGFFRMSLHHQPDWRHAILGASITIFGWIIGSVGFQFWMSQSTSGGSLYGPLAAPIALLVWLQVTAFMVFVGGAAAHGSVVVKNDRGASH